MPWHTRQGSATLWRWRGNDVIGVRQELAGIPIVARLTAWRARVLPRWVVFDILAPIATTRGMLLLVGLLGFAFVRGASNKSPGQVSPHPLVSIWTHWES